MKLIQPVAPAISTAKFKAQPCDFIVTEMLSVTHTGHGEHLWLYVQKTNLNTAFVARLLAEWAGVPAKDVGYSGLKDRHATTHQWFSIRLPTKQPPSTEFGSFLLDKLAHDESVQIEQSVWYERKLNRGTHFANHFKICLRQVQGEKTVIDKQLTQIAKHGVPNYFGMQRFGKDGANIKKAQVFFDKILANPKPYRPHKKFAEKDGLLISAARSVLFNALLAKRVADSSWDQALSGDVFNLDGTASIFSQPLDESIKNRIKQADIHPTAPLYGIGTARHDDVVKAMYDGVLAADEFAVFCQGLHKVNAKLSYRALRVVPNELSWGHTDDSTLTLHFSLPKGCFATALLSYLVQDLKEVHSDGQTDE